MSNLGDINMARNFTKGFEKIAISFPASIGKSLTKNVGQSMVSKSLLTAHKAFVR